MSEKIPSIDVLWTILSVKIINTLKPNNIPFIISFDTNTRQLSRNPNIIFDLSILCILFSLTLLSSPVLLFPLENSVLMFGKVVRNNNTVFCNCVMFQLLFSISLINYRLGK